MKTAYTAAHNRKIKYLSSQGLRQGWESNGMKVPISLEALPLIPETNAQKVKVAMAERQWGDSNQNRYTRALAELRKHPELELNDKTKQELIRLKYGN